VTYRTRAGVYLLGIFLVILGTSAAMARSSAEDHSGWLVLLFSAMGGVGFSLIYLAFTLDRRR
jgi:energy-converting hydrogenase Eha subunit E